MDFEKIFLIAYNNNDINTIKNLINENKVEINSFINNNTPLHHAIFLENPKLVEYLLEKKADPNLCHHDSSSPLIYAISCHNSNLEIVKLLIKYGANINYQNRNGYTAS
jgi:uncharacterized protein